MDKTFRFKLNRVHTSKNALFDLFPDLPWYGWWLQEQLKSQPSSMFQCLRGFDSTDDECLTKIFLPICSRVSKLTKENDDPSIDSIFELLLKEGYINAGDDDGHRESAATLVFGIIGWLTMLYRPDLLSSPPTDFCIADEMDGHRGDSNMSLRQDRRSANKRLPDFLLGFGLLLPPMNLHTIEDAEELKLYNKLKFVEPSTLNLFLLTTIGGVSVAWTDSLACHLELDKDSRLVYLFRYPSFCRANLRNAGTEASIIHACASDSSGDYSSGAEQDVSRILEEVMLSYRLLFGQNIRSRRLFRKISPFQGAPPNFRDDLLTQLCTSKNPPAQFGITQHDTYELERVFPHLRTRIVRLNNYLNQRKPRSWSELWVDNRDSASWLTFWAVIIIGGLGLLLAFIQVILQIIQLTYQLEHPGS